MAYASKLAKARKQHPLVYYLPILIITLNAVSFNYKIQENNMLFRKKYEPLAPVKSNKGFMVWLSSSKELLISKNRSYHYILLVYPHDTSENLTTESIP